MKKKILSLLLTGFMVIQPVTAAWAAEEDTEIIVTEDSDEITDSEELEITEEFSEDEIQTEQEEETEEVPEDEIQISLEEEAEADFDSEPEISEEEETDIAAGISTTSLATEDGIWTYDVLDDGSAGIIDYNGTDTEVTVPGEVDGHIVTKLGTLVFAGEYKVLPGLGGVYESNETITSVTIPASVNKLYTAMFGYMDALEKIIIDGNNRTYTSRDGVLFSKDMTVLYVYPAEKADESYVLPEETTTLEAEAFCWNPYIADIDLNHIKNMENSSISGCHNLKCVDFGDSCTKITGPVINYCKNLEEIQLPSTLTELKYIMSSCENLSTVRMQAGGVYCCEDSVIFTADKKKLVFYPAAKNATEYTIPDSVTELEFGSMSYLRTLRTLNIPSDVTAIRGDTLLPAGGGTSSLEKIKIYNPECYIYDDGNTIPESAEIWGYADSTAYEYASDYGRTFVNLEDGSSQTNEVTWKKLIEQLPVDTENYGEPVYQTSNVIHESNTSSENYIKLKNFTDELVKNCTTDYEKTEKISRWVHSHITYKFGALAGNTIDSVYSLFNQENPEGSCMAYTRLTAYMLYLAGIPSVEAVNVDHEWCMVRLNDTWYIVDSTNDRITEDYSDSLYASPSFLSFSKNGNVYAVKNNSGIYLCSIDYENAEENVSIPDFVDRIQPSAINSSLGNRTVTARSGLVRELKKYLDCVLTKGNTAEGRKNHSFGGWAYVDDVSTVEERTCSVCGKSERHTAPLETALIWTISSYTDTVGKSITLKATTTSNSDIFYRSSDSAVVSVNDSGVMTLKKEGTAVIYLSTKETGRYKAAEAQIQVQVIDMSAPEITDFRITGVSGSSYYFTVSWTGIKNADYYYLCSNNTSEDGGYHVVYFDHTGTGSYTGKYSVSAPKGTRGRVWISAYNRKYRLQSDSQIKYIDENSYKPGTTTVKVTSPKTNITSLKNPSGKKMQIKWKKKSSVTGYQIQYATDKKFTKNKKTVTVSGKNTTSRKITGLKKKKTYYVRIRTYKKISGKRYYSDWSSVKKIKITK